MAESLSDVDLKSLWNRNELIARHRVGGKPTKTNANITIGEFDSLLKRLYLAEAMATAELTALRTKLETVEADRAAQAERIRRLEDVLDGIYIYANDTLSGRVDGPDDRAWQRSAVVEIRNRARKFARAALGGNADA